MKEYTAAKEERGKRLRLIRTLMNLSVSEFAKELTVSNRTINGWESGSAGNITEKSAEKIVLAAKKYNVSTDIVWILHGVGNQPQSSDPIYNKSGTTIAKKNDQIYPKNLLDQLPSNIKQEIIIFLQANPNAIVLQILDDAMEPHFKTGDIVGGIKLSKSEISNAIKQPCIIETETHQVFCRFVTKGSKIDAYELTPLNSNNKASTQKNQILLSTAPITWIRKTI